MAVDKAVTYCLACCCCSALIVSIVLFAISFSILEATEMGLDYSSVSKSINEEMLYSSGRHMLGVGHGFKVYPKDQQSTKFPSEKYGALQARTMDGLAVTLEMQYQFRLVADLESVVRIYYDWGLRFEEAYAINARNILRDIASNWTAYEFFYNRTEIEAAMQLTLQNRIEQDGGVLDDLQLLDIQLPAEFESELTKTEQIRQEIEQMEFDVQDAIVRASNKRKRMFDEAKVISNDMIVVARQMFNTKQKQKKTLEENLHAEVEAYVAIRAVTNLTTANMFNYIWLQNLGPRDVNHLHMSKPTELHCWADPNDHMCPTSPGNLARPPTQQLGTFSCPSFTSGKDCVIVVPGQNLQTTDLVRIGTDASCEFKHADYASETYASMPGPKLTHKVFNLGTVGVAGDAQVCYCKYSAHAQGCSYLLMGSMLPEGLQPAFENIGSITVS